MSTARRVLENTFVQVLGKVVTAGLSIIILKIISGYLGTAGYGDYTTVYQFLAFFGIAADFGIYSITVKEMSKDTSKIPQILGNVMGLRTALIIVTMGLAAISVYFIPGYSKTVVPMGVLIATLSTFFTLLNGTVSSVLQVHLKMQYATYGLIIGKIVSVVYMVAVVYMLFTQDLVAGFNHLLWAGVIGNAVNFFITGYFVNRYGKITYQFDFGYWKKIFLTSLPYGVALVLNTVYVRIGVILMTLLLPHSSTLAAGITCHDVLCGDIEVGMYGVAMRFLEVLVIIPVYFMNSVLPIMTRFIEEKNERIKELMQYSFDFLVATGIPILVGAFVLAVPIIMFISSPEFISGHEFVYGADYAVKILMFAMFFSFINSLFGFTLLVLNQQIKLMYINAACVVLNIVSNLIVIPVWGFRGAAFTSVVSEVFILICAGWAANRALGFRISGKTLGKLLLSACTMGLFISLGFHYMINMWYVWQLAVLVPVGGVVYGAMVYFTGAVSPDMLKHLKKS